MTFRDDRDAQRHRIESLERELVEARVEADRLRRERDLAREERDTADAPGPSAYPRGTSVYVEWRGGWWDAHVLQVLGPDRWRVRYDGWSSRWDEDVGRDRIASRAHPPPGRYAGRTGVGCRAPMIVGAAIAILLAGAVAGLVSVSGEGATLRAGPDQSSLVRSTAELRAGQPVWIEWNGSWYLGSVLRVNAEGTVLVHYDGYADSYDEPVTVDRLRAP